MTNIKNFTVSFLSIIFLIIFSFLFILSFFTTGINFDYVDEVPILIKDNIFVNAFLLIITSFIIYLVYIFLKKKKINTNILLAITVVLTVGFSILWVLSSNVEPDADQTAVCYFAHYFNELNYFGLIRGEYVGKNQQQLGLISIIQIVYKLFGDGNYRAFQLLNTAFIGLFVVSNDMIIRNSFFKHKEDAEIIYLLLVSSFIPLFIYSDYVYGEVISIGSISLCFWMISSYQNNPKIYKLLLAIFGGFLSCYVRLNSIIFIIAVVLVLIVSLIIEYNNKKLFTLIGIVVAGALALFIPKMIFGPYVPSDSYSMPARLYIAMGMQGDAGWFNSYNTNTYIVVDADPVEANKWAKDEIRMRLDYFKDNPSDCLKFYYNKINLQWNSPMMQALWMNSRTNGYPGRLAVSIYEGNINKIFNVIVNCHQMFIYLMCIVFSISEFKDRNNIRMIDLVFVVFVIGGFLFSILWEAKTRYILPYYSMLLVEAALGFTYLSNK